MASILDLYNSKKSELKTDTIKPNADSAGTPYSIDDSKDPDLKVLTPEKLKSGYKLGDLGGGSPYAGGYSDAKGKTYSSNVKRD
jgi:hypothetical protein